MKEFKDKVAVVTGAASGIGRALAQRCVDEGMKVVLADVEEAALLRAEEELAGQGGRILAVVTDVSKAEQVQALRDKTLRTFGAVHLLFNNAGIGAGASVAGSTLADWKWVVDVNLWGVIHGTHSFLPVMMQQKEDCHVVNTASVAGLTAGAFMAPYTMSKHAVVSMSESLYNEMKFMHSGVGVSVLCPGFVQTQIMDAARNRPPELVNPQVPLRPEQLAMLQHVRAKVEAGMPSAEVAAKVFDAIREERFYIVTHPNTRDAVRQRAEDLIAERNPRLPPGWGQ